MIFGTHWEYRGNSTEYQWDVATLMQGQYRAHHFCVSILTLITDLWLSFAADKSTAPSAMLPDGSTFTWPEFAAGESTLAQFAEGDVVVNAVDAGFIDENCEA